ncbi:alpha-mannosidase 2 [Nomia melanderi]|uniref:alpha-mannosidase 2 n=1 Tax=Nomia melanderi TaxID=2448451 RepID=UPI0013043EA3|nr:alpha-mannosidase 2 [Nomia melanderi]XP_031825592.1 alpha-mannosidase 2 [Nomia melanderi]XP_031825593.1 alpha-mannosidase 2 [Nomia melanderi]XP_031825594.1 alpha-mannosidase 2 [Nomia melanderi]
MRTRKTFAILGAGLILACCVMIYLMMDLALFPPGQGPKLSVNDNQWLHFENRLAKLEKDFNKHHEVMNALREVAEAKSFVPIAHTINRYNRSLSSSSSRLGKVLTCNFNMQKIPEVDIQMLEMYRQLEFDNIDGGVWKQGWDITYDDKQWHPKRKLKVFVVPHSHNDPGWLSTFEKYYTLQTRNILNNMVLKLVEDRRRKFIWAEISFFQLWWEDQSKTTRNLVRRLIHDGQLEIVSGGWVMPDESVSHWMAQLTQLTEGHQWLKYNLDYTPNSAWSIDPFGLSPTMPYLLKNAGLENVLIQRVHYSVKKKLAREKHLEFRWRQLWDNDGSTEIFTHVMPFYSYDVPHTCGPDPKICCQFDFFRLQSFGLTCPWKIAPRTITKANVAERAALLLDQYRKKAQLFKTDVVLAPLGDDFRYTHFTEWDAQYTNYQKLFDYMNKNEQLNVEIKFGTLSDYFDAVKEKYNLTEFPTLSGDFFTYSDRDDHYWSGYYTSRPFHKRLDRVLLSLLRASEILNTIAWSKGNDKLAEGTLAQRLSKARMWHSLFQHHDGISGTARDEVVIDYAKKMIMALNNSAHVLQHSVVHLLKTPQESITNIDSVYITLDESRLRHTSAGDKQVLILGDENPLKKVILYNSLPRQRTKVQTLIVSTPYVKVTDRMGQPVQCQISPIWIGPAALTAARYELSFLVTVPGFGITTYIIHALPKTSFPSKVHLANVTVYNTDISLPKIPGFGQIQVVPNAQEFSVTQRPDLSASFGKSGLLKALKVGNTTFPAHLEFVKYGTRGSGKDKSGAYLFLPDKPEPDLVFMDNKCIIHLITGPIVSKVFVELAHVRHTCILYNSPGSDGLGLHILNEVDISETQNYELAMRLSTDIASGDQFFTDLNGLNMIKRQRFPKLPTQGNYYPMAASAYIEDKRVRLTVVTAQPLGVSSMASGQIEIMQDRRLLQDDNRGLGQGVTDNLLTNHWFMFVLEKRKSQCPSPSPTANHPGGLISLYGHLASEELLHPIIAMHPQNVLEFDLNASFAPLRYDFPIDLSVVSFRVFPIPDGAGKGVGMVLHRAALDMCWNDNSYQRYFNVSESGEVDLTKFFYHIDDWIISKAPLTFHNVGPSLKSPIINLCPHQILPILFHKTQS